MDFFGIFLPLTPTIFSASGIFLILAAGALYYSFEKTGILALRQLAIMFVFFSLYLFSWSLPAIFFPTNLAYIGIGYVWGVVFAFGILLAAVKVGSYVDPVVFRKTVTVSVGVISALSISSIVLSTYDFRFPSILPNGLILWNANPVAAWLISLACLYMGFSWTYIFYKAMRVVPGLSSKIKMGIFCINGVLTSVAATLIYTATNEETNLLGLSIMAFACFITLFIFILPSSPNTFQN